MYQQARETGSNTPTNDANAISSQQFDSRQAERNPARAELAEVYVPPLLVQGYSNGPDLDEIQNARQHKPKGSSEPSDSGYGSTNITFENSESLRQLHSETRTDENPSVNVDVVGNLGSQTATSQYPSFGNSQTNQSFDSFPPSYIQDTQTYSQPDNYFTQTSDVDIFQDLSFDCTPSLDPSQSFTSPWPPNFDEESSTFPSFGDAPHTQ
ncbi:uncharacterized protein BDR25DRAFT_303062 [Lindgomyces ingoldianus]|uniref:Uncharacterized protein n=1 Tax=Lindgomyces ingoldianus TaxID=673940 RepID=A0ACB6QX17_9PLEO|nr:uncharacterized protein BDR25DRAFT_303062 [Lindgomyces ingoldianus]KAF2471539.1 hypothetical protein BDR25DRAFT_303062 [Lindgomyces ingoldianus]